MYLKGRQTKISSFFFKNIVSFFILFKKGGISIILKSPPPPPKKREKKYKIIFFTPFLILVAYGERTKKVHLKRTYILYNWLYLYQKIHINTV